MGGIKMGTDIEEKTKFETKIKVIGNKALVHLEDFFDGKVANPDIIKNATKMIGHTIKVIHMGMIQENTRRSQALRLLKFLPSDAVRKEYIKMTNPEVAPLLLSRPKKKK